MARGFCSGASSATTRPRSFGHHFIHIAKQNGLRHLSCMLATRLEAIEIEELETLGFTSHKFPGYGADPDGKAHDMTLMVFQF